MDENIERQMNFIIEHQAKFSSDLVELGSQIGELKTQMGELAEQVSQLASNVNKITDVTFSLVRIVEKHDNQIEKHDAQIEELIQQGKDTDARLGVLIDITNQIISGGGKGLRPE